LHHVIQSSNETKTNFGRHSILFLCAEPGTRNAHRRSHPQGPHHHLVLENEYVRVFRVSLPAHDATLLHQHDVPNLYVSLGPADVINAVQGKPEARIVMADGQLGYSPGHFAHIARTDAGSPFNNVTIELLRPQGEARNLCERIIDGPLGNCPQSDKALSKFIRDKRLFETDDIFTEFVALAVKVNYNDARRARLLIACDKAELGVDLPGEPSTSLHGGEILWLNPGRTAAITNLVEHGASRYLLLSFKDKDAAKKP
jgi:hypothetical protein